MTPRERVRRAINHQEPDRVPFILGGSTCTGIHVKAYENLRLFLGLKQKPFGFVSRAMQLVDMEETVLKALDIDIRRVAENSPAELNAYDPQTDMITDEWGLNWRRPKGGLYYDLCNAPLRDATVADLDCYPWPDPNHRGRTAGLGDVAKDLYSNSPYAIFGDIPGNNLWENAWGLRGLEQCLLDLLDNKSFVHALMRKITNIQIQRAINFLAETGRYIDILRTSDDLGTQRSLFMSPASYREMIKPYQREYFSAIKAHTDAKIHYHCCGAIYPLIEDLIDVGIDILNPVQVSCETMDSAELKAAFGDRISFCGAVDTQRVLPCGTSDEVAAETRKRISDLGPGGGYLLTAVHSIQADVPPENIVRMFETGKQFGRYPL